MVKDISYYKSIQNSTSITSNKEYSLSKLRKNIESHFADSVDYEPDTKVDGITQQLIVVKTKDEYVKTVIARPTESINVGQTVDCYNQKFLVISVDSNSQTITQGKMQQCNTAIKFQSPDGTILSYPCIDSKNTGDEEENKTITVGSTEKVITIPYNESTILLQNGRRFFIDRHPTNPKSYEIIAIDTTSKNYGDKGLIILTVKECVGENTSEFPDRVDLGVCNYFEPVVPTPIPVGESYAKITISGDLTVGGSTRTLTPIFYNADNTINTTVSAVWNVVFPVGYESYFTQTDVVGTNKHTIKVVDNDDLIGLQVVANVSDGIGGFEGTIELTIKVGY